MALASLALVATSCGGNDDVAAPPPTTALVGGSEDVSPDEPAEEPAAEEPAAEEPTAESSESAEELAEEPASGGGFPLTITHKFGEINIESQPERVVSVGYSDQDVILALGVVPVGIRDWYGDQPFGVWPWAQDELGDAEPVLLSAAELEFEAIAALRPDLIIGISSGMTQEDYELLAQIAPTLAQTDDYIEYGTPWDVATETIGEALGKSAEAQDVVADIQQLFADARADHPEFEGASAAVAFQFDGLPGAYATEDSRPRLLADLGFVTPTEFDELAGDEFFFTVSEEEVLKLDAEVIVWLSTTAEDIETIRGLSLRPAMTAYSEGREILSDPVLTGAMSFASPLSFEFMIERLVPELALAVDGDIGTSVPSAIAIDPNAETDAEPSDDESAAGDAWSLVFDSTVAYDDKAAHLDDAEALHDTVDSYEQAGSALGGIFLVPTAVIVDGDTATVTYDVMFGDSAAYTALEGTIGLIGGTWVVGRDEFCSFMASARNACPA